MFLDFKLYKSIAIKTVWTGTKITHRSTEQNKSPEISTYLWIVSVKETRIYNGEKSSLLDKWGWEIEQPHGKNITTFCNMVYKKISKWINAILIKCQLPFEKFGRQS